LNCRAALACLLKPVIFFWTEKGTFRFLFNRGLHASSRSDVRAKKPRSLSLRFSAFSCRAELLSFFFLKIFFAALG
jgi:hypothetical protein